jgi:putative ABC transport system ATP-binding protein
VIDGQCFCSARGAVIIRRMKTIAQQTPALLVDASNLSKSYRNDDVETRALAGVGLQVAAGEFLAVMGPSGCGKSSLLNVLGLLDPADGGSYRLLGDEVTGLPDPALARLRRRHVGFVFQGFNLIDDLTVVENVEVAVIHRGLGAARGRLREVLDAVGMSHRAGHRPCQLSGGQQQRVAIARALAADPSMILADEPTGNLDSANGDAIMDLLRDVADSGTAVVMATHSAVHAAAADRIITMLDGAVVGEARS